MRAREGTTSRERGGRVDDMVLSLVHATLIQKFEGISG
jgi:hypothetical protein